MLASCSFTACSSIVFLVLHINYIDNVCLHTHWEKRLLKLCKDLSGADPGGVKWVNFHPPRLFLSLPLSFFFLIPHTPHSGFGSITLLQIFTPHFKILDPCLLVLHCVSVWEQ